MDLYIAKKHLWIALSRIVISIYIYINQKTDCFQRFFLDVPYLDHVKVAEILLKNGANVQGQSNRYRDSTPLHVASSMLGSEAMVKLLIQNGAKVDATDAMIKTPLHLSRNYNGMQMIIFFSYIEINVFV